MPFGRRVRFALVVLTAQLLLVAMAIAWCVHMVLIARHGEVYFVEANPFILYGEIVATVLITLFAVVVFVIQYRRLGERRGSDRREQVSPGEITPAPCSDAVGADGNSRHGKQDSLEMEGIRRLANQP